MWYGRKVRQLTAAPKDSPRGKAQESQCAILCKADNKHYDPVSEEYGNCPCQIWGECPLLNQFGKLR